MPPWLIENMLQVVVGGVLLNVWLLRAGRPTGYRGGLAQSLRAEFQAYGLPEWMFYAVGTLKVVAAILLIVGIWVPSLVRPAAGTIAALMIGALAMHLKVADPAKRSLPAFLLLAMCLVILRGA